MKCPPISDRFIFADDAKLAAELSCALSAPGIYLPVCDGPRMQRPDNRFEILRRHNAMGRTRANIAFMAGLPDDAFSALSQSLNSRRSVPCHRISVPTDIVPLAQQKSDREVFVWGRDRIGVGLLKALRAGQSIRFDDTPSPYEWVTSKSGHLVVCEDGEEISQVIAANYAYALDAGLFLIPKVDEDQADDILEAFYKFSDRDSGYTPAEAQSRLTQELLNLCGSIPVPEGGSITFIGKLPFGFAYPEHPSTHLFEYPDLGCAVVNGFAAEQPKEAGTGVVVWSIPARPPLRKYSRPLICWSPGVPSSGSTKAPMRACDTSQRWSNIFPSTYSSSRPIAVTVPAFVGLANSQTRKGSPAVSSSTSPWVFSEPTIQTC
jgi:hypothetical protein